MATQMNGNPPPHNLTQADADWILDQLINKCPGIECQLKAMEDAGLPNPVAQERYQTLRQIAHNILRVYFPDRVIPGG